MRSPHRADNDEASAGCLMLRSEIRTSKRDCEISASASGTVPTAVTVKPSFSRTRRSIALIVSSSSTTRTVEAPDIHFSLSLTGQLSVDALPCRTGREARIKFGDEPAIDARNAAGFGCGFVARVAFTSLCCAGEKCAGQKFVDCGTGEYVLRSS